MILDRTMAAAARLALSSRSRCIMHDEFFIKHDEVCLIYAYNVILFVLYMLTM